MKKYLIFFTLLFTGCSSEGQKESTPPAVKVEVSEAKEMEVPIFIQTIGNIIEKSIVQIRPQVQGILLKAYVKQGQEVKKGQLLYEIDPRPYKAALDQAVGNLEKNKALLAQAKITLKRNKELVEKKYIPLLTYEQYETDVKTAEAQVKISEAEVETAKINLSYCTIFSPINGKISVFNVYPGNLVLANDAQSITEIRQLDPIDVQFTLPQNSFQILQESEKKRPLQFEAYYPKNPKKIFTGTVDFIDNHVNLSTGTVLLKGVLNNRERLLWPGEFVNVKIVLKKEPCALVIPDSAVQPGSEGPFVYVIQKDMTAKVQLIKEGERVNTLIVVKSGIKAGEKVVVNGQLNLKNGTKVHILEKGEKK